MALRKPKPGEYNGPSEEPFNDVSFREDFPTLNDYLTNRSWADGSARITSTLLVFIENDVLKVCINDRDNARSCFVSDATFTGLLEKIELGLKAESLDWRMNRSARSDGRVTPF